MNTIKRIYLTDPLLTKIRTNSRSASLIATVAAATALIAGCSMVAQEIPDESLPPVVVDVSNVPNAIPKPLPLSKYGNPVSYVVAGKRYYTMPSSKDYKERGIASWYGTAAQGKRTSSGDIYDNYGMTAAHRTLPLPSFVKVTNRQNGRSVIVKVNDRGPFHNNRLIDLSYVAAVKLGIVGYGTGLVEVAAIDANEYDRNSGPILREARVEDEDYAPLDYKTETAAMNTDPATTDTADSRVMAKVATQADSEEAVAMATDTASSSENRWKFWQWRPGNKQAAGDTAEQPSMADAALTADDAQPSDAEKLAMADEVADSSAVDGESSRKFWQWRPGKQQSAIDAAEESATSVAAVTATEAASGTAAATGAATQAASETVTMAAEAAESSASSDSSRWKFWQWKPTKKQTASITPEEAPKSMVPEAVASNEDIQEATPGDGSSRSKFWQWRPTKKQTASVTSDEPPKSMVPEAVASNKDIQEATPGDGSSRSKFWQWRPTNKQTPGVTSDEPPKTMMPEAVASNKDIQKATPGDGSSRWKIWQWRPAKGQAESGMGAKSTTDTVVAAADVTARKATPSASAARKPVSRAPMDTDIPRQALAPTGYYLQTGAFRMRENAERLRADVDALVPGAFNIIETTGSRRLYKIQIGPLQNKDEAMRIARQLKAAGINPKLMESGRGSSMMASKKIYRSQQSSAPVKQAAPMYRETVEKRPPVQKAAPAAPAPAVVTKPARTTVRQMEAPMVRVQPQPAKKAAPAPVAIYQRGERTLHQQAGAFAKRGNAVRLRSKIVDETLEPTGIYQEPTDLTNDGRTVTLHKVQVGPLTGRNEAMRIRRALEPLGITDSFPVYREK